MLVVMGVSGSGKTTVGRAIAARAGWPFLDSDDLHSPESIARMAAGIPLTDADRWPWLERIAEWIAAHRGEPGIVACSALKRIYRDRLRAANPDLRFVYLKATQQEIADRLAQRTGHFFPPTLAQAQFRDLQEPGPDENPITVPITRTPDEIVDRVLAELA
jgi:gluconokinase